MPPERVLLIFTMPPAALVADDDGLVVVAWTDARHGDWDVFVRRSVDGGDSWGERQRLNDDLMGSGRHQYLPGLAVAPSGRVDATFYDRRGDPENVRNHVYYASSTDGGERFSSNVVVTSDPSDSRVGQRYAVPSAQGRADLGSRLALTSINSGLLVAWTDTRNARTSRSQDIAVAEVVLDPDNR